MAGAGKTARGVSPAHTEDEFDPGWYRAHTLPNLERDLKHAALNPDCCTNEGPPRPFCSRMWKTSQMVGFVLGVLMATYCKIAQPCKTYPAANDMLAITVLCGAFWTFQVIPIYVTALIPAVMMPVLEVTNSENVAKAYWHPVNLLVLGIYLVDIAITTLPLPRRLTLKLLMCSKKITPGFILWCIMLICWGAALFVNNIAVALIISPFAASLVSAAEARVQERLSVNDKDSADGSSDEDSDDDIDYMHEVHCLADALMLGIAASANAGGMATLTGCIPNAIMMGTPNIGEAVTYRKWTEIAFPISVMALLTSFGVIYFRYIRHLKGTTHHEVVEREHEDFMATSGVVSRDEWVVAGVAVLQVCTLFASPLMQGYWKGPSGDTMVGDATLALCWALLLFFVPSQLEPGYPVLKWQTVQENLNFGLMWLMGGGFAIAYGFKESGLNIALARYLIEVGEFTAAHPIIQTTGVLLFSIVCTQIFSSFASAAVLLPAWFSVALSSVTNPLSYVLPATMACSFSFCLPAAAAPNLIVMAKSQEFMKALRTRDFLATGVPICFIMALFTAFVFVCTEEPLVHAAAPFPKWACDQVSCMWVHIPGFVRGVAVNEQACAVVDADDGRHCTLQNNTRLSTDQFMTGNAWMDVM